MRKMHLVVQPIAAVLAYFAASQHTTGGTALTPTGTGIMPQPAGQNFVTANPVAITADAGSGLAGLLTVTGTDRTGNVIKEVIASPTTAITVYTKALFNTVTSVVPATTEGTVNYSIGYGASNYSPWLQSAYRKASVVAKILAAGNYQIQITTQNILDPNANQGPFYDEGTTIWPLLVGSRNSSNYEDDGTYSGGEFLGDDLINATQGTTVRADDYVGMLPSNPYAYRIVTTTAAVQFDVNCERGM